MAIRAMNLRSPDGARFPYKLDPRTFYDDYVESWRVTNETSLFDYAEGESTEFFTDRRFPYAATEIRNAPSAREVCEGVGVPEGTTRMADCQLDVEATGEEAFAESAVDGLPSKEWLQLPPQAYVRWVNLAPGTPTVDALVDGTVIATLPAFGDGTEYGPVEPGLPELGMPPSARCGGSRGAGRRWPGGRRTRGGRVDRTGSGAGWMDRGRGV